LQFGNQRLQALGPQPHLDPVRRQIHPLDQQPHDARLLGREQFIPQRRERGDRLDDLALWPLFSGWGGDSPMLIRWRGL
jgi:hypothetical protein